MAWFFARLKWLPEEVNDLYQVSWVDTIKSLAEEAEGELDIMAIEETITSLRREVDSHWAKVLQQFKKRDEETIAQIQREEADERTFDESRFNI